MKNRKIKTKAAPKTQTEVSADAVNLALRMRFNPIRGLTPQTLSAQLDNFYLGFIAYAALTWDAIERRDDVLKGVAAKRKKAVARLKWQILALDDSPEAEEDRQALGDFYNNIEVVNALDENERGGFPLLVRQMMDAVGKYYAVHEIVWIPGEANDDGSSVGGSRGEGPVVGARGEGPMLTAQFRHVPLWFFENRTGRLRFLSTPIGGAEGEPLDEGGWMITKGDGLMEACSVAYMFKNLPMKDWLAYSDKFGTPGVLGQTTAARGTEAGNAMRDAVASFGQNFAGVVYGADGVIKEPISLVTAHGAGELPFPPLIERMDRAMTALWRGSDLSTISADNQGASVQGGETELLLADDAAMISETLNLQVDPWVIWQKTGRRRPKAYIRIIVPEKDSAELDLKIDELLLRAGARLGERERLEHYGRPMISPDDTPLHNPAVITERVQEAATGDLKTQINL